jgi:hypothetical protein
MTSNNTPNTDPLSAALNINPLVINTPSQAIKNIIDVAHDDSAKIDFEIARANIHELIHAGKEAIDSLGRVAENSQQARDYEVLAKLIDSTVKANRDLLELQARIRDITNISTPTNNQAKSVTNNLFVGSTTELQKLIKDIKEN